CRRGDAPARAWWRESGRVKAWSLPDENNLKIADVGVCRPGDDEVPERLEELVRIVVVEVAIRRAQPGRARARHRRGIDDGPRGIGRTVDTVGADAGHEEGTGVGL